MSLRRTILCSLIFFGGISDSSFAESNSVIYELPSITFVAGCADVRVLERFLDEQIEAGGFASNIVDHTLLPAECTVISAPPEKSVSGWMRFHSYYNEYITLLEVVFTIDSQSMMLYSFELVDGL